MQISAGLYPDLRIFLEAAAFFASLSNGTSGIFRADPKVVCEPAKTVPDPTSTLGLLAFAVLGTGLVRKRKQKKHKTLFDYLG